MIGEGVTIMICTYNGMARLHDTLGSLLKQEVPPGLPWEVLIVDNNSTDGSADAAEFFWSRSDAPAPLRVIHQPEPGLTASREMGIQESSFEYVILCDDDNWLAPNYVAESYRVMRDNPNVGLLGGNGTVKFEIDAPEWMRKFVIFASGPQGTKLGKAPRGLLYGAGSVLRRSAYVRLKESGFNFLLSDRKGQQLSSGGDHELCYALVMAGYELRYDPALTFVHYITKERISWEYYVKYLDESSNCFSILETYKNYVRKGKRSSAFFLYHLGRSWFFLARRYARLRYNMNMAKPDTDDWKFFVLQRTVTGAVLRHSLNLKSFREAYRNIKKLDKQLQSRPAYPKFVA